MTNLKNLTLLQGIALAIGSVMGSGILFLPALIVVTSGQLASRVWILTTLLCIPMIFLFRQYFQLLGNQGSLADFIGYAFGNRAKQAVPLLFLGTVSIGMPISTIVVGHYILDYFQLNWKIQGLISLSIIGLALFTNLRGLLAGARLQIMFSLGLFLLAALILIALQPHMRFHYLIHPVFPKGSLSNGILLAFWAYAGFENLTFIAKDFKNPQRDFTLAAIVALISCGLLYLLLSLAFLLIVPPSKVNHLLGLYQLALYTQSSIAAPIVMLFAVTAVQINFNSWLWGISRLLAHGAEENILPRWLANKRADGCPVNSLLFLALIFLFVSIIFTYYPQAIDTGLHIVSTNFVFLYLLTMLSAIITFKQWSCKFLAVVMLLGLLPALSAGKWLCLYPLFLFSVPFLKKVVYLKISSL